MNTRLPFSNGAGTGAANVFTPLAAELFCAQTGAARHAPMLITATNLFNDKNMIPPGYKNFPRG
jgi:hypothetical protein